MIKKLVIVFVAVFTIQGIAQKATASPYSFYGIGTLKFKGTVENRSMGGLSIFTDSIHINLRNPAGYAGKNLETFNNESRPVKFTVGGSHSSINLESNTNTSKSSSTSFDYFALAIPVGKFGFGFGLLPYTSVGYKLESFTENGNTLNRFDGEGGVNKVFLALGYQITDALSVGIDVNYNFGNIQNSTVEFFYDAEDVLSTYQSQENNRSDLSGLNVNLGLSHKTMISEKFELVSGITFSPESQLVSKNQRSFSTIAIIASTGQSFPINTIDGNLESQGLDQTNLVLPTRLSLGTGIGEPRKWFVGAEYSLLKMSNFSNPLYSKSTTTYQDATTFALGGFYIPQYNSFTNYLKRMVYRAGVRFETTGLVFNSPEPSGNNEPINEFGISFGIGLPVGNGISNANLGFEIGKRGTTNNNLIQENFINFQLSLSLNDRWFVKRKYD